MRTSTSLALLALFLLLAQSPVLAGFVAEVLQVAVWVAVQPPVLAVFVAVVVVRRVRGWVT